MKEEFWDSLVEVVIMPMNKEHQTRLIKSLFQKPFAKNFLFFKDFLEVLGIEECLQPFFLFVLPGLSYQELSFYLCKLRK